MRSMGPRNNGRPNNENANIETTKVKCIKRWGQLVRRLCYIRVPVHQKPPTHFDELSHGARPPTPTIFLAKELPLTFSTPGLIRSRAVGLGRRGARGTVDAQNIMKVPKIEKEEAQCIKSNPPHCPPDCDGRE